jgi:hypothetical protein
MLREHGRSRPASRRPFQGRGISANRRCPSPIPLHPPRGRRQIPVCSLVAPLCIETEILILGSTSQIGFVRYLAIERARLRHVDAHFLQDLGWLEFRPRGFVSACEVERHRSFSALVAWAGQASSRRNFQSRAMATSAMRECGQLRAFTSLCAGTGSDLTARDIMVFVITKS